MHHRVWRGPHHGEYLMSACCFMSPPPLRSDRHSRCVPLHPLVKKKRISASSGSKRSRCQFPIYTRIITVPGASPRTLHLPLLLRALGNKPRFSYRADKKRAIRRETSKPGFYVDVCVISKTHIETMVCSRVTSVGHRAVLKDNRGRVPVGGHISPYSEGTRNTAVCSRAAIELLQRRPTRGSSAFRAWDGDVSV